MSSSSNMVPFPSSGRNLWIEEYQQERLSTRDADTIRVYRHILQEFTQWVGKQAGKANQFEPSQIDLAPFLWRGRTWRLPHRLFIHDGTHVL